MPKKWAEVEASPQYQALGPDQKEAARQQYFREVVQPQVPPDQVESVRKQFNAETYKPQRRSPGMLRDAAARYDREHNPTMEGVSTPQTLAFGVGKSVADTGLGIRQALGMADQAEVDQRARQDDPLMRTVAGNVGDFGGVALQMMAPAGEAAKALQVFGKAAPYVGAGVRAGAFTATQPVQSGDTRLGNVAQSMALGAAGQGVANVAGKAAASAKNAITPEVMRLYQSAKAAGIPVHFSQLTDSKFAKTLASAMSYFPLSGAGAKAKAQQEGFNRAVSNTFYADAKTLTDDVMQTAKDNIGKAYDKVFAGQSVGLDRQAAQQLFKLHHDVGSKMTAENAAVVRKQVERIIDEFGSGNSMPGEVYQSLRSELRKDFPGSDAIAGQVKEARRILDEAAGRALGPARGKALGKLNAAYANLKTTEGALKQVSGAAGNVKPSSLYPLVRNGSTKEMRELAKVGQVLLKDPIPDSGTAGRLLATGALGGGAFTGVPLLGLAKLMALGATVGRAANSDMATRYVAKGNAKTLGGLARLAKGAPIAFPSLAAAKEKERP